MNDIEEIPEHIHRPLVRPWVRFWARTFDYYLLASLIFLILNLTAPGWRSLFVVHALWVSFVTTVLWIPLEAWILTHWGSTLGKALLRVSVKKVTDRDLTVRDAWHRSALVWIEGMGLGIPIVSQIVQIRSYFALKTHYTTPWDHSLRLHVSHERIGSPLIILFIFLLFAFDYIGFGLIGQLMGFLFLMQDVPQLFHE